MNATASDTSQEVLTEKVPESIKLRIGNALVVAHLEPTALAAMFVGTIHDWCKGCWAR